MPQQEEVTPIRLIFYYATDYLEEALVLIYEEFDGTVGRVLVYDDDNLPRMPKIRFIDADEGESRVVWVVKEERRGLINKTTERVREVKEVLIRRDAQGR